jgi:hypothetical protein
MAPGLALLVIAAAAGLAQAQPPAETKTFENARFRFTVALPAGCRHENGPGTIDAVCSPDFDPERSAVAANASALVLGVAAEPVAGDAGNMGSGLKQRYGEAGFREELAEAVCGESDKARVKVANVKEAAEDASVVYSADVVCAAVGFLQIGERRASVRHVITPDARYRLVARALAEDFDKERETIDAFFASFQVLSPGK